MHCFSGKGCSEFPKSMHYWVGILRRAANNYNNRKNSEKKPGAQTGHKGTTLSKEKVEELLRRAENLPLSETDAFHVKKIELSLRDAMSSGCPADAMSTLLSALVKVIARYEAA